MRKADITVDLVEGLIASQFPQWDGVPVTPVEVDGWDNTTFRLGSSMSVRLPSADAYVAQVEKEHRWLPVLAPQLPVPIPVPLGRGDPCSNVGLRLRQAVGPDHRLPQQPGDLDRLDVLPGRAPQLLADAVHHGRRRAQIEHH